MARSMICPQGLAAVFFILAVCSAAAGPATIGTGRSQAKLTMNETTFFEYTVSADGDGNGGYLNHFWAAGSNPVDRAIFRYYIDGEAEASIVFTPALACGVGFGDQTAPWGTKWVGKGAQSTGWFHNIPVPFHKSIRVTFQKDPRDEKAAATLWAIVRGSVGLPLTIGNLAIPLADGKVKLELQRKENVALKPLEFYDLATIPAGNSGTVFMTALFVNGSKNWNFMEGCFHMYSPPTQPWPGLLLSTGMEDYYDSAFYFNGGGFHLPVAGETHKDAKDFTFSGYRFHEMDPLVFGDGVRMQWRNGDVSDPATGLKCTLETGGTKAGDPQPSVVSSYAWVYVW